MKKINLLIFALVIIISVLALTIFLKQSPQPEQPITPPAEVETPSLPDKQPIVHYPVPVPPQKPSTDAEPEEEQQQEIAAAVPTLPEELPPVQQSDKSIQEALTGLKLKKTLFALILSENFIQKLVTTIDNLPEKRLPRAHLPVASPKGRFITSGTADSPQTSRRNRERYNTHVQLLEALNQELVVKIYVYFYPLFQTAYEQLGYKNSYFNDRLVNVIDHLLETPTPAEPMPLAQPSVLFTFADPLLEKLSSGQKVLLRIGPEHRLKVKKILKSYRQQLVNLQP